MYFKTKIIIKSLLKGDCREKTNISKKKIIKKPHFLHVTLKKQIKQL